MSILKLSVAVFQFFFFFLSRPFLTRQSAIANNTIIIDTVLPTEYDDVVNRFNSYLISVRQNYSSNSEVQNVNNPWIQEYFQNSSNV